MQWGKSVELGGRKVKKRGGGGTRGSKGSSALLPVCIKFVAILKMATNIL